MRSVSRTTNVVLRFSEPVTGVSGRTIRLRDTVTGHYVTAVVTYNATLRRATLNPSVTLAAHRRYRVVVSTGITDRAGNPLRATSRYFTTGAWGSGGRTESKMRSPSLACPRLIRSKTSLRRRPPSGLRV